MWRACGIALVAVLLGSGMAAAQERLVMPYTCEVSGGRLFVAPSVDRSYIIAGRREQEPFAVCSVHNPSRCRTWQIHRFELECDGARVPWVSVVAAAPPVRGRRMWVENDRLHLRTAPLRPFESRRPCPWLPWRGRGERFETLPDWGGCESYSPRERSVTVLPTGFAPLMQLDARIVPAPPLPVRSEEPAPRTAIVAPVPRRVYAPDDRTDAAPRGTETTPQDRAAQDRAAQDRAAQDRAVQDRAVQDRKAREPAAPRAAADVPAPVIAKPEPRRPPLEPRKTGEGARPAVTANENKTVRETAWPTVTTDERKIASGAARPTVTAEEQTDMPVPASAPASGAETVPDASDRAAAGGIVGFLHRHALMLIPALAALAAMVLGLMAWRLLRSAKTPNAQTAQAIAEDAVEAAQDAPQPALRREPVWPDLGGITAPAPERAAVEDLMRNADDFYVHVVQLAGQMQPADPLRDVVADELAAVDASLRAPALAKAYADEDWARLRQSALQALTDLERIRRIVQSAQEMAAAAAARAAASTRTPSAAHLGHPVPTTREEALAVLGVNDDASEKVIKKIVDAMRQTWHPDLARDDIDRRTREERMKQINIAWDILRPQRQAA